MATLNDLQTARKRLQETHKTYRDTIDFWHKQIRKLQSQQYQEVEKTPGAEKNKIKQQWQLRIDGARRDRDQQFKELEERINTRETELAEIENAYSPQARQFAEKLVKETSEDQKSKAKAILEGQVISGGEKIGEDMPRPIDVKWTKRKKTVDEIPIIGEKPKTLPPQEVLTPEKTHLHPAAKEKIFLPKPPPIALPPGTVAAVTRVSVPRTIERQIARQQESSASASRIQQIANFGPVRKFFHNLGAVTGFNRAKAYLGQKIGQGIKKGLKVLGKKTLKLGAKVAAKLGARGLIYAAGSLSGLATGGIGTAITIGLAVADIGFQLLKKFKKAALAVALYALYWLSTLLHSLFVLAATAIGAAIGAAIGFAIAGPVGAVVGGMLGGAAGNALGRWLYNWWNNPAGSGASLTESLFGKPTVATNPLTGQPTLVSNTGGPVDIITGSGPIGTTIVPASIVGVPLAITFGMAGFLTFFTAMHFLVAFTVPNPLGTQSAYIIYGDDGQPIPLPNPLDPTSSLLNNHIAAAAGANCVPDALIKAIMQTESAAYTWTNNQYTTFSTPNWWTNASVTQNNGTTLTVNCYNGHYTARNGFPTSQCQQGYCYDTCTESGVCGGTKNYYCKYDENLDCSLPVNAGHPNCSPRCKGYTYPPIQGAAPPYSRAVLEALPNNALCSGLPGEVCSSFAVSTENKQICPFDRDGSDTNSKAVCTDYDVYGATQFERETFYGLNCRYRDGTDNSCYQKNQNRNRCNASDVVTATAEKLSAAAGSAANCTTWTVDQVCAAAKNYCGSCGRVQNPNHPLYSLSNPCFNVYAPVDPSAPLDWISGACGGSTSEGYCDKVAKLYFGSGQ